MTEQERIWRLVARRLANEATEQDLNELQELLQKRPEMTYSLQVVSDIWKSAEEKDIAAAEDAEKAFHRHQQRMKRRELAALREPFSLKTPAMNMGRSRWRNGMLRNSVKVAWRSLVKNKGFSFINILGLSIGMASALLILLWISFQFSVDQFHTNKDRIYQLFSRGKINGQVECWAATPMVLGPVIQRDYPDVEALARINWVGAFVFSTGNKHLETQGYIADPDFLKIFSFPLLHGNPETALRAGHSVVLTERMAHNLFGDADAMGQVVKIDSNALFTVTGILKDLPYNTRFNFDYLVPWSYTSEVHWNNKEWDATTVQTIVMLKQGVNEARGNALLRNVVRDNSASVDRDIFLHPMSKWRLYSSWENGHPSGGAIRFVQLFAIIAGLILLIACINYMNLSTARSMNRAREVGIRKTVGAVRTNLILQFMGESVGVALIAGILALIMLQPGLMAFNKAFYTHLSIPFESGSFWLWAVGFILLTGCVAGSYPALYMSSFRPMHVLKGIFKGAHNLLTPRKVLVVLQFTVAIVMMICTIVIYRQIDYARKRDVGYDREGLSYVYIKGNIDQSYPAIREAMLGSGLVSSVTRTNSPITDIWTWDDTYRWDGKDSSGRYYFATYLTYKDLVSTMGLTLMAGRDINLDKYPSDSNAMLINETTARLMKLKDPVGQVLVNKDGTRRIVGVLKDFIPQSPYSALPAIVCLAASNRFGTLSFRWKAGVDTVAGVDKIKRIFTRFNPDYPFAYYTTRKSYSVKFEEQESFGTLAAVFASLAIFISCMGLFGLAASTAESRIKEIGVRKVLGASVSAITALLSKDFLKWVVVSFCIASPLAWWVMRGWLSSFDYRVGLSWWIFTLAGGISVLIAGVTVSYQAIRAALGSPAKALRSE